MKPLNKHVQVEPQKREDFIATTETTYNEVGTVVEVAEEVTQIAPGDTVFFDSWMASKFPHKDGTFFYLVPFENIKAYERQVSEK